MLKMILFLSALLLVMSPAAAEQRTDDDYIRSDRLGIAHISSESVTPSQRYEQALRLGAGWNRWPIYWDRVERTPGDWTWEAYDEQVQQDLEYGLQINAILIGVPGAYRDGERPAGIYEPIFADGTDEPGAGKALNSNNPWAIFAQTAVNRYKPGGELAASGALPFGTGIRIWEIWNEPDFDMFWRGTARDYARMLKVSYIVIKAADPSAQVMFGGLLYPTQENFLAQVMNIYFNDPMRDDFNWFMDIVAVHNYGDPWRSAWLTLYARQTLIAFDISRPIWLNETGVPVWDDYPGPTWEPTSTNRATLDQQAWFFIQSAAFAWTEGADKVILHQLYDDCGDQPAGTDFPPHNGDLCELDGLCYGDAHGIFRNYDDSACFAQHPQPGTPRPLARAYRLVADVFGTEPFDNGEEVRFDGNFVVLTFNRPRTNEKITVMWNRRTSENTITLPAVSDRAQLISLESNNIIEVDASGDYQVTLPPAQDDTDLTSAPQEGLAIGGSPYILIEARSGRLSQQELDFEDVEIVGTVPPATAVPTRPAAQPTVDPTSDSQPPIATVLPLPATSPASFTVEWTGEDDSGIANYLIWVRKNDGEWEPWVNTDATSAIFTGEIGSTYAFAAWAVDLAGNWSPNVDVQVQASTRLE